MHCTHAFNNIYLAEEKPVSQNPSTSYLEIPSYLSYRPFCDDFGPLNLGSIHRFCTWLDSLIDSNKDRRIVVWNEPTKQGLTNACFLLGAYMILKLGVDSTRVEEQFDALLPNLLSYRDMSPGPQNFDLRLEDCWQALSKGGELDWVDFDSDGFDVEEYNHYDDPLNGDLHVIVPNKLIAMKGPVDLPDGQLWMDTPEGSRDFSPEHCAQVLRDFNVSVVVRLNEPRYAAATFHAAGIAVADMPFDDCRPPPEHVVAKFLLLVESAPGAVAVHCEAGLGRTGTLLGLHLIKSYGLTARQAMAWLRIVRPGSVIGEQQRYLCEAEPAIARIGARPSQAPRLLAQARADAAASGDHGSRAVAEALWGRIRRSVDGARGATAAAARDVPAAVLAAQASGARAVPRSLPEA